MLYYMVGFGVIFIALFVVLPPRYKALIALVLMTNGFDMTPSVMAGWITWDYGAVLLLITGIHVFLLKRREPLKDQYPLFAKILLLFWLWLFIPLGWSLLIYQYPIAGTIKYSRHMIVGYLSFFIFLRLFQVDPTSLRKMLQGLYVVTYMLLVISVIQFFLRKQILFGLYRDYASITRFVPIMLPFCLLRVWYVLSNALTGQPVKKHEIAYSALAMSVLVMTFTRGLYLAALATMVAAAGLLFLEKRLSGRGAVVTLMAAITVLAVAGFSGGLDLAAARFKSGIDLVTAGPIQKFGYDVDTFSGRLRVAQERMEMSAQLNPIVGYGFLNEDNVTQRLRNSLRYGSIIYSPEMVRAYRYGHPYVLALHTADISWGDLVLNTGFIGLFLFTLVVFALFANYFLVRKVAVPEYQHLRLAFLLGTLYILLITLNSNSIVVNVQIFAFMLAGYAYTSAVQVPQHQRPLVSSKARSSLKAA